MFRQGRKPRSLNCTERCVYRGEEGDLGTVRLRFSDGVGGLFLGSAMIPRHYETGCYTRISWICTQNQTFHSVNFRNIDLHISYWVLKTLCTQCVV